MPNYTVTLRPEALTVIPDGDWSPMLRLGEARQVLYSVEAEYPLAAIRAAESLLRTAGYTWREYINAPVEMPGSPVCTALRTQHGIVTIEPQDEPVRVTVPEKE